MLSVQQISCRRAERTLFSELSFTLARGQCLHVTGNNGIGKTSLLRILAGLSSPFSGAIYWDQKTLGKTISAYRHARLFLGHKEALKEDLSLFENLQLEQALTPHMVAVKTLAAALNSDASTIGHPHAPVLAALNTFGLRGYEYLPVASLSAGQKRRGSLARLLVRAATLWILDEPFNSLDANACAQLSELLVQHVQAGGMLILTSHQALPILMRGLPLQELRL